MQVLDSFLARRGYFRVRPTDTTWSEERGQVCLHVRNPNVPADWEIHYSRGLKPVDAVLDFHDGHLIGVEVIGIPGPADFEDWPSSTASVGGTPAPAASQPERMAPCQLNPGGRVAPAGLSCLDHLAEGEVVAVADPGDSGPLKSSLFGSRWLASFGLVGAGGFEPPFPAKPHEQTDGDQPPLEGPPFDAQRRA